MADSSPKRWTAEHEREAEKVFAHKVYLSAAEVFSRAKMYTLRSSVKVDAAYDVTIQGLALQMVAFVAGEPKEHLKIYRRWPRTWWDACKERWFPGWLLRRFPANYEVIDIDRTVAWSVCPHLEIPESGPHVVWLLEKSREPVKEIYPDA